MNWLEFVFDTFGIDGFLNIHIWSAFEDSFQTFVGF